MGKAPITEDTKRQYTMSRIKNKDTTIELLLRKSLWNLGIRYKKNYALLPGSPDIVITKYKIVIFCDGDFWHGKEWDEKKKRIKNNKDYWVHKIEKNIDRDKEANSQLNAKGWIVLRFWGSEIKKDLNGCINIIEDAILQIKIDANMELYSYDNDLMQ